MRCEELQPVDLVRGSGTNWTDDEGLETKV